MPTIHPWTCVKTLVQRTSALHARASPAILYAYESPVLDDKALHCVSARSIFSENFVAMMFVSSPGGDAPVSCRVEQVPSRVARIMGDGIRIDDTDADLQSRFAASYPAPHVSGFFPFDSSLYPLPQSGNSSRTVHRRGRLPAGCPPVARPSKLLPSITLVKQQHDDGTTKQNIHSSRWSSTTNLSFRSPAINRLRICE